MSEFDKKRSHLLDLSDEELHERFWQLTDQLVNPLIQLAKEYTSPSIERSILLRMGFSSIEATTIVKNIINENMLEYGAGNLVLRYSIIKKFSVREAGMMLLNHEGFIQLKEYFEV